MTRGGVILRLGFCALMAAVIAAIWIQDHGRALPLGLFNEGRQEFAWLSDVCLAAALVVLTVFVVELALWRPGPRAGALRGAIVSLILIELMITVLDWSLVSRGAEARLGGPYRELQAPDGEWVTVKKAHAGSPLGFRSELPTPLEAAAPRVLFLGDSYTEGSGRGPACNYPEVAVAVASERLGSRLEVFNAGVAGYGPEDAGRLLRYLAAQGFEIDAIVYSLFLENDFTDNLPGTERRVVAGINFRFPSSPFLRLLHPLNSRTFRYALFFQRTHTFVRGGPAQARRAAGECQLVPAPSAPLDPELLALAERRLRANYAPDARVAEGVVERELKDLRDQADALGVPFLIAVFPDRVLADETLRSAVLHDAGEGGFDLERLRRFVASRYPAAIDVSRALTAGAENYRVEDTHLSDLGNLRAGRFVGEALARSLERERTARAGRAAAAPTQESPSLVASRGSRHRGARLEEGGETRGDRGAFRRPESGHRLEWRLAP